MAFPIEALEADVPSRSAQVDPRLRWLVAVHLVVSMAPVVSMLHPDSVSLRLVVTAAGYVQLAELTLLAFWVGMGTSNRNVRLLGALLGSAYVTVWPNLAFVFSGVSEPVTVWIGRYLGSFSFSCLAVGLFAVVSLLVRRRFTELRRIRSPGKPLPRVRFQYSILHLLTITSIVAIVLGLACSARLAEAPSPIWMAATLALVVVVFLIISVCAAWSSLGIGPLGLRIPLVFLVPLVLVIALAWALHADSARNHELFVWSLVVIVPPTAIIAGSLLIVRSCGYRLIPRGMASLLALEP